MSVSITASSDHIIFWLLSWTLEQALDQRKNNIWSTLTQNNTTSNSSGLSEFFQVPWVQNSSNPVTRGSSPPCFAKCVINIQSSTIINTKTPSEGWNYLWCAFIIFVLWIEALSSYPRASVYLWHNKQLLSQFGCTCHFEIAVAIPIGIAAAIDPHTP